MYAGCVDYAGALALQISFNELLTGSHIAAEEYEIRAEENLMELKAEQLRSNRLLLASENVLSVLILSLALPLFILAGVLKLDALWRGLMIAAGLLLVAVLAVFGCMIEQRAGYYECPRCHEKHIPGLKEVILAPHIGRRRRLVCPHCHQKGYHFKVLEK